MDPKTPNEEKHEVNSDGVQLEAQQSVGEEKHDLNGPDEDCWIPKTVTLTKIRYPKLQMKKSMM